MDFDDLTPEQQKKARACKTPEQILELAKSEGYELTNEELNGIAAGGVWSTCNSPYWCSADGGCYGRTR